MEDAITLRCTNENAYCAAYAVAGSGCEFFTLAEELKERDVSQNLSRVPLKEALQAIGHRIKLSLVVGYDQGVATFMPKHPKNGGYTQCPPGAPADSLSPAKMEPTPITLRSGKIAFLVALRRICDQAHVDFRFAPDAAAGLIDSDSATRDISVDIAHIPVELAISSLLRRAGWSHRFTFGEGKNTYNGGKAYVFSLAVRKS